MNVQDYISSGIVESYVLGLASDEEQREFEKMSEQHPEVKEARIAFEIAMEEQAMQNAIAPPASLRADILRSVNAVEPGAKVITMDRSSASQPGWLKYAAAAAILLLVGSAVWNISLYNKNRTVTTEYARLQTSFDSTVTKLNDVEKSMAVLMDNPNIRMAAMKGLDPAPAALATVYWDSTSKDVYLMVNNLPKPANDKQYQLWALLDGKPIDVGMIDNSWFIGEKKLLLRMKNTSGAQAFAITLEKKGGSPAPQGTMYTLGNL